MNVFLFGASGPTGLRVVDQLLTSGYRVKAMARNPESCSFPDSKSLTVLKGDVMQPDTFQDHFSDIDVVISTLGTGTNRKPTNIYSEGGRNMMAAMKKFGIKKLIVLTAAAFDTSDPQTNTFIVKAIVRQLFKNIYTDMEMLEKLLEENTDIDWICIRPTRLTSKKGTGKYRTNLNHSPKGGRKISRKDLSKFIVEQVESDEYIHEKPVVAY
ncbi:NAD(P)-dependent oxidoreductase [Prolixibacter denitrificans]|uniref:NAD-dependent dehydratase n=1 Tax=Prolixibacter denitrificans TaxID=1541063 RepID=A0A2P8C8H5_9BACT|nr:SDR family oxidoreductase [Prolixibacter denitrificans]PSK81259.1 putative NADH-flavin reductase [Prolixibacter denitrificans]GET21657.1 NAD-dependent dehydratase [Prolixibacter denitrificans]